MCTFSIVFKKSGNLFQILGAIYERFFCLWLVFPNSWLNLNREVLVVIAFWTAGLNTSFIYKGLKLLKWLKVIELIHILNWSFMGNQFIFSNSIKPIWCLLFRFWQNPMHLFWSICNFDFNLLFRLGYQAKHTFIIKMRLYKNLFFLYKNQSLQLILLITFKAT